MQINPHKIALQGSELAAQATKDRLDQAAAQQALEIQRLKWQEVETTRIVLGEIATLRSALVFRIAQAHLNLDEQSLRALCEEVHTLDKITNLMKKGTYAVS